MPRKHFGVSTSLLSCPPQASSAEGRTLGTGSPTRSFSLFISSLNNLLPVMYQALESRFSFSLHPILSPDPRTPGMSSVCPGHT